MAVQEAATLTDGSEQATGPRMPDAGRHGWLPSTTSTPARSAFGRSIWSAWRWRGRLLRGRQAEGRWRRHNSSSFPSSTQPLSSMSRIPKEYLPSNSNRDGAEQTGPRRAEFMWNTGCRWSKQQQQHVSAALVAPITARKMEWLCCGPGQRVVPSGLEVAAAVRKGGRGSRPKGIVVV